MQVTAGIVSRHNSMRSRKARQTGASAVEQPGSPTSADFALVGVEVLAITLTGTKNVVEIKSLWMDRKRERRETAPRVKITKPLTAPPSRPRFFHLTLRFPWILSLCHFRAFSKSAAVG